MLDCSAEIESKLAELRLQLRTAKRADWDAIYKKIRDLKLEMLFLDEPMYSDGIIDLYLENKEDLEQPDARLEFIITLHSIKEKIGYIDFEFWVQKRAIVNVSYTIEEKYRGKNYTLKALNLLKPLMRKKGDIANLYVDSNNIPSNKLVQSFGGRIVSSIENSKGITNAYEVDLTEERKI